LDRRVNISDVAKKAGVSKATISNYLNKTAPVSKKTAVKIEKIIKDLNYSPNYIARALRTGRVESIGIMILDITDFFYVNLVDGMQEIAVKNDYSIILACSNYDYELEKKQVKTMINNLVSGFIFCTGEVDSEEIERIQNKKIPVVTVDRKIKEKNIPSVEADDFDISYKATDYLIKKGHKDILFISEPITMKILNERLDGYKEALKRNNLKVRESNILIDSRLRTRKVEAGYEIMKEIINKGKIPTAVLSSADSIIYGAIKATQDLNLKVPDDISFIGGSDFYLNRFLNPALTTVPKPAKELGKVAMQLLINLISGKKVRKKKIILDTNLVERDSVKDRST